MPDMQDSSFPSGISFMKMHGAGNDFVIIDSRGRGGVVTPGLAAALGDRHFGVGFDQLAEITSGADTEITLNFWNADGSSSSACGNATRCVAKQIMEETGVKEISIRAGNRVLTAVFRQDGLVWVNMGHPELDWEHIPLTEEMASQNLPIDGSPDAVGMGNPHCVRFLSEVENLDIAAVGPIHEVDPIFQDGTNAEYVKVLTPNQIRMRVWERGTGVTLACGSGACAVLVAAHKRGLCDSRVSIVADGGTLFVDWREDGVWLSGPTALVFNGSLSQEFLQLI